MVAREASFISVLSFSSNSLSGICRENEKTSARSAEEDDWQGERRVTVEMRAMFDGCDEHTWSYNAFVGWGD